MPHLIFCFKTNRPGAWRIGGWGLDCRPTRQAHDGKYQLGQNAPTDILPPCQEMVPRLFDQGIEAVRPQGLIGQ